MNRSDMNWDELGVYFGYPQCCITSFSVTMGIVYNKLGKQAGNETGFVPCPICAKRVLSGAIKLENLITNRECNTPFPHD